MMDLTGKDTPLRAARTLAAEEWTAIAKHIALWIGVVGSLFLASLWIGRDAPVWPRESVYLAGIAVPIAAGAFVQAAWIGGRSKRNGTKEIIDSTRSGERADVLGVILLGIVPLSVAVAVQLAWALFILSGGPVGPVMWLEVLTGPAVVLIGWLAGAWLGWRFPAGYAIPGVLLLFVFFEFLSSPDISVLDGDVPSVNGANLALWTPPSSFDSPESVLTRPSLLKLSFLLLGAVSLAAVLLASAGQKRSTPRWISAGQAVAVVLLASVAFVLLRTPEGRVNWNTYIDRTECQATTTSIEYCSLPLYKEWTPRWQAVIESVSNLTPVNLSRVVQRPSNVNVGGDPLLTTAAIGVGTEWDRSGTSQPLHAFRLALTAAFTSVRLPTATDGLACSAIGQGRAVYALWIALESVPRSDQALDQALGRSGTTAVNLSASPSTPPTVGGAFLGLEDARLALDVASRPTLDTKLIFDSHRRELSSPELLSAEVAQWFGIVAQNSEDLIESGPEPCG